MRYALRTAGLLLGILLLSGISADPTDALYTRPAVKAPQGEQMFFGEEREGNEIDLEIQKYFREARVPGTVHVKKEPRSKSDSRNGSKADAKSKDDSGEEVSVTEFSNVGKNAGEMASHKVADKDTVYSIARKYDLKPEQILKHNPELSTRPLYIGEEVLIVKDNSPKVNPAPAFFFHTVRAGDTLLGIAGRYRVTAAAVAAWNGLQGNAVIRIGQGLKIMTGANLAPPGYVYRPFFIWPVQGIVTSGFGVRWNPFIGSFSQFHRGVDIGAGMGTTFRAAADGVVIASARMGGYGNCIFIRHADGYVSVYGHLKVSQVKRGDVVKQGDIIGQVGRTGTATGPHLHFEVRRFTQPINPFVALNLKELVPVKKDTAVSARVP